MNNEKYAYLMVEFKTPEIVKKLHKEIPEEELYRDDEDETNEYGLEKESHVTIAACLPNDTTVEEVKKYLLPLEDYDIIITDVSKFDNEKFDVLKCNVRSSKLHVTNKKVCDNIKSSSEFKEYHPHLTIAYMKKGMADKYTKELLDKLEHLEPVKFILSNTGDDNKYKQIKFI